MQPPKFSIITVSYNSAATIRRTIESVVNQTYRDFEYILVDGASTDGTVDIILEYAERFPEKIRYVSEPDTGIYNAMNKGIKMSRGYMVGILNSDDWYEKDTLEKVSKHFYDKEDYVLYGMVRFYDGQIPDRAILNYHDKLSKRMLLHAGSFVTRSTYKHFGRYDERYRSAADYDCFLRFDRAGVPFYPILELVTNFSLGGMSSSYLSSKETNEVLMRYGLLNKKQFMINTMTAWIKFKVRRNG